MSCVICSKVIYPNRLEKFPTTKTCSTKCNNKLGSTQYGRSPYQAIGLSPGTVGAISELRVAVDLMTKGYHVFRAQSPHCPCDLVILSGSKLLRVEVRSGYIRETTGRITVHHKEQDKSDILAVTTADEIVYTPRESEWELVNMELSAKVLLGNSHSSEL